MQITARSAALLATVLLAIASGGRGDTAEPHSGPEDTAPVLDGTPTFVVVGSSTSCAWPSMHQDLLDEHSGAFAEGRLHPDEGGAKIMAVDSITRDHLGWRGAGSA